MSVLSRFWVWCQGLGTLTLPEASKGSESAPLAPIAREPVADVNVAQSKRHQETIRETMARIVKVNNANVTRDYGTHKEDFSYAIRPLTDAELRLAAKLDVVVVDPKPRIEV